ncbi:hypothetical protein BSKO_02163 [Bryopsis sp. KO-2023]|nr:hypothetical protein BSKO_02163 [Bryopsis sp. KO-2023]
MSTQEGSPTPIPPPPHPTYDLDKVIRGALEEDSGGLGDVTSLATIPEGTQAEAWFLAKADGVLAGVGVAIRVFEIVDANLLVKWVAKDGDRVQPGMKIGQVTGSAQSILVAERIALNFMQRMSGIATATHQMVEKTKGTSAKILETRKTTPGLRMLDKWAVLIGGGQNHRMGLYDMMMIKDNHIAAAGGIRSAVERAHSFIAERQLEDMHIEVETRTMAEVTEIIEILEGWGEGCRVSRVMLDNMAKRVENGVDVSMLKAAVDLVGKRVETEASGNVTIETIKEIASTGVDYVSCGALTHSVIALDISLKIETKPQ